jgi:hypothetical protein
MTVLPVESSSWLPTTVSQGGAALDTAASPPLLPPLTEPSAPASPLGFPPSLPPSGPEVPLELDAPLPLIIPRDELLALDPLPDDELLALDALPDDELLAAEVSPDDDAPPGPEAPLEAAAGPLLAEAPSDDEAALDSAAPPGVAALSERLAVEPVADPYDDARRPGTIGPASPMFPSDEMMPV